MAPRKAKAETAEKKTSAKKAPETETVEEALAETKAPARKRGPVKRTAIKETVYVQYMGNEVSTADILKKVKTQWTKVLKNKVGDMKDVTLYVKPEEGKAYYVVNGDVTGSVEL